MQFWCATLASSPISVTLVLLTEGILKCTLGVHGLQARQHAGGRSTSELTHAPASMRVQEETRRRQKLQGWMSSLALLMPGCQWSSAVSAQAGCACRHRVHTLQVGQRAGGHSPLGAHACGAPGLSGGDRAVPGGAGCAAGAVRLCRGGAAAHGGLSRWPHQAAAAPAATLDCLGGETCASCLLRSDKMISSIYFGNQIVND